MNPEALPLARSRIGRPDGNDGAFCRRTTYAQPTVHSTVCEPLRRTMQHRAFWRQPTDPVHSGCCQSGSSMQGLGSIAYHSDHGAKVAALGCEKRSRAPGAVDPGSRRCRRYADPPAATLLTGLAGGERLSQFLLQLVCPSYFGRFCATTQELSLREIPRS